MLKDAFRLFSLILITAASQAGVKKAEAATGTPTPSATYYPTYSPAPTYYPTIKPTPRPVVPTPPPVSPTKIPTVAPTPTPRITPTPTCTKIEASASCSCSGFLGDPPRADLELQKSGGNIRAACHVSTVFNYAQFWCSEISMEDIANNVFSSGALNCYCDTPYFSAAGYITEDRQHGSVIFPNLIQSGDRLDVTADGVNDSYHFSASYKYNSCSGETGRVTISTQQGLGDDYFSSTFNHPLSHGQVAGSAICRESGEFHGTVGGTLICQERAKFCSISGYIAAKKEGGNTSYASEGDVAFTISHWGNEDIKSSCSGGATFSAFNSGSGGGEDSSNTSLRAWLEYRW